MNISFDFDSTLSEPYIQKLAKSFIQEGHNVFITTTRTNRKRETHLIQDDNSDLEKIANKLGIERVIYTAGMDKLSLLPEDTHLHFDDDMAEVELINLHMEKTVAVCSRPMIRTIKVKNTP